MKTLVQAALDKLKENGLKRTPRREELIKLFADENRYLSAKEVQQFLETENQTVSFDTIYRNLYSFVDIGILEMTELNNERLFRITCLQEDHHHHHFICERCGRTIQLEMCPMDFFEQQLEDCRLLSHRFEIFGICGHCLAEENQNK